MFQRDYFLRLSQELSKVIAKLLGLKERGEKKEALQVIDEAYKELLHINSSLLKGVVNFKSIEEVKAKSNISNEQLEAAARLLFEEGEVLQEEQKEISRQKYKSACVILEYLNHKQKMYSFDREDLLLNIRKKLRED